MNLMSQGFALPVFNFGLAGMRPHRATWQQQWQNGRMLQARVGVKGYWKGLSIKLQKSRNIGMKPGYPLNFGDYCWGYQNIL